MRRPLESLRAGVARFRGGDLGTPVDVAADDELGAIAVTLNEMASSIAAQTRRLARHGERLEGQVRERTAQLEASLAAARRADDNRRRTLANVGHELRTPLTVIRGEADIALRGASTDPQAYRAALERTREAAVHTATLVDDLLFVARNERGEARLALERVDLVRLVRDTLATFAAGTALRPGPLAAPLRADPHRVRQALLVLVDNASRHGGGRAGGRVEVRVERGEDAWHVLVEDDGPGMDEADKAVAFTRFFRGSNAAERYGDGLGLGLPVALSIAEAHGGTITLRDADGGGLVAALVLPAESQSRAVA